MKKYISLATVFALVFAQSSAFAFTSGPSQAIPASGTLQGQTSFTVTIRNVSDDAVATQLNANAASAQMTAIPQYVEVNFSDNNAGDQAVVLSTNNRAGGASPRFSPGFTLATGAGLVGQSEAASATTGHGTNAGELITAAPLQWVVFDTAAEAKTYAFTGNTATEFYVVDRAQAVATELDIDPVTAGIQPPPPFADSGVLGFASVVSGISGQNANLAAAPTGSRTTTDGQVFVRMAVNYSGQSAQAYASNTLTLELITL